MLFNIINFLLYTALGIVLGCAEVTAYDWRFYAVLVIAGVMQINVMVLYKAH